MNNDPFDRSKYNRPSKRIRFLGSKGKDHGLSAEQISERRGLEKYLRICAAKADIRLKKASLDGVPEVEVFFDLFYGGRKIGYLLNQWNSSMLRLGSSIKLRKDFKDIQDRFRRIHHICGVHHISLLYPPTAPQEAVFPISLETAVYLDGFNERVFKEMVHRFAKCQEMLRPLLEIS